ncbi:hypothetical protein CHS0354_035721 [Potamilus streckersoni]|uniref:Nudix hydrolase domain-containing protein n=1 Tax=Potamilus streckersoni TaxID=2493646 RepID=A0AAE0S0D7_9BIVA|nr:hypothetical protein CHS0354_035721 [Potamilus streckersoni]
MFLESHHFTCAKHMWICTYRLSMHYHQKIVSSCSSSTVKYFCIVYSPQHVRSQHSLCFNNTHSCKHITANASRTKKNGRISLLNKFLISNSTILPSREVVTLNNIFSESNKMRVQQNLNSVKAVRSAPFRQDERKAAVLIPMCMVDGQPSLLFMVRSSQLRNHRGEVSFPGGMMDSTDKDLVYTALRESHEEIGLPIDKVDVWGQLRPTPSKQGDTMVTPTIGYCGELDIRSLRINKEEVASVFTRTIKSLCDPKHVHSTHFRTGKGYVLPVFLGGEHRIWGLTAIFVHQLLTLTAPGLYTFKLRYKS